MMNPSPPSFLNQAPSFLMKRAITLSEQRAVTKTTDAQITISSNDDSTCLVDIYFVNNADCMPCFWAELLLNDYREQGGGVSVVGVIPFDEPVNLEVSSQLMLESNYHAARSVDDPFLEPPPPENVGPSYLLYPRRVKHTATTTRNRDRVEEFHQWEHLMLMYQQFAQQQQQRSDQQNIGQELCDLLLARNQIRVADLQSEEACDHIARNSPIVRRFWKTSADYDKLLAKLRNVGIREIDGVVIPDNETREFILKHMESSMPMNVLPIGDVTDAVIDAYKLYVQDNEAKHQQE